MAKTKEIVKKFKMQAPGGTATPAPPIGPALGANGVNPGQFIQRSTPQTAALKAKSSASKSRSTPTAPSTSSSRPRPPP